MNQEEFKRKLTAILSADVEGYSRLMGEDEDGTIRTLTTYRELMSTLIQKHRGRVVDSPGDNLLAEFGSVVDAVRCAVEIQEELRVRNAELPENRRMDFRIGINLGDVVEEGERIYGDGVNITARVEGLAEAGGICISGTVYDSIKNKLSLSYESMGEHTVKNITEPVRVYRMRIGPEAAAPMEREEKKRPRRWRWAAIGGAAVLIIIAGGLAIWNYYFRPTVEPASVEKMAFPLPDKPSIAVLPFVNISEDKGQEYFSDGLTEEIISALSRVPKLFVIARNSTFTYKGKPVKVQQVSEELGVRYVLEGSVRKAKERVRITAQLIDAITGHHLWSESYDRDLKDIFALQDEITMKIVNALRVELTEGESARLWGKGTTNLKAYLKALRAREHIYHQTKEGNILARRMLEEAIALDPEFPPPYHLLAGTHMMEVWFRTTKSPKQSLKRAVELTQKAIALDDSYADAHGFLGFLYTMLRKHDKGVIEAEKAVALDPNGAWSHLYLGFSLRYAGRFEEAVQVIEKAIRLNPFPPVLYFRSACMAYIGAGRYEEAIAAAKKTVTLAPDDFLAHISLAAAYSLAGRKEEARSAAEEVLRINPKFSLDYQAKILPFKNKRDLEHFVDALRKAGLPETPPLPLPGKPSIAVLPFVNMSGDPEQEYFSDGITEEIITALSKVRDLFVIARNSSFTYKGKAIRVPDVARELGVRYVLEGSVRMAGDKVRITAQLIDGATNHHVWSERYDRELKDVFAIQDDVTMKILTNVKIEVAGDAERTLAAARRTSNLQAYLKILEGIAYNNKFKFPDSRKAFEEALSLDPNCAVTYVWLAWNNLMGVWFGPSATRAQSLRAAFEYAEKGLALDDSFGGTHNILGHAYLLKRDYDNAIFHGKRAVELNPNSADSATMFGWTLRSVGRYEEAVKEYERAMRLDPMSIQWPLTQLGTTYVMMRRHEEAVETCRKSLELRSTDLAAWITLVMAYSSLDRMEEARAAASEVLKLSPNCSVEHFAKAMPYKNEADREFMANTLRKAGMK